MSAIAVSERAKTAVELGESHFREFKSALDGPPGEKKKRPVKDIATNIAQTLVAFANADGGELLVGVEDNGEISGLPGFTAADYEALEAAPVNRVHQSTPLPTVRKRRLNINGKEILYFSVSKSVRYIHLTSDGRCLQRRDLESIPVSAEAIQFDRKEQASREYDRKFVDGVSADDLDLELVRAVADQVLKGMSPEKCLQYLELGEYGDTQLRLRRAALLLFAKTSQKWHPRLQIRILKVDGQQIRTGEDYNVIHDEVVQGSILNLVNSSWEALRPYLVQTKIDKQARFEQRSIYPELACREALLNSIAHRDYSDEGRGIEVYIYDDHLEIKNPGALLSSMNIEDIITQKGVHQSRNTHVARVLRELGYMRELGEGMRRIYDLMQKNELSAPELTSNHDSFSITLTNRAMYSPDDALWLSQFETFALDRQMKSVILLGRNGRIFSASHIWDAVGIVDTEDYRKLVESLLNLGVLTNAIERLAAKRKARAAKVPFREFPRYKITIPGAEVELKHSVNIKKSVPIEKNKTEPVETLIANPVADGEQQDQNSTRFFVAKLPLNTQREELYKAFESLGSITEMKIPRHSLRKCKGYAFVTLEDARVSEIIENGVLFREAKLYVTVATPQEQK
jgi:ATP-dependent DNA helicase RecG